MVARIILILALLLSALPAYGAGADRLWYQYPELEALPGTARFLVYDPTQPGTDANRKSRNVTWSIISQLLAYVHPATHPATMITEDTDHQYVTAAQKLYWNAKVDTDDPRLSDAREPKAHTQDIATVNGLQLVLDNKIDSGDPRLIDARAPLEHTQGIATIDGLQGVLDGKEPLLGFTPIAGTDPRLSDARPPLTHNHSYADLSDPPTIPSEATQIAYNSTTVAATLDKLAPAKPIDLSACTLSLSGTYTALQSGTGTSRNGVIDSQTPTGVLSYGSGSGFYDGDSGVVTALVDGSANGQRTLSTADDTGTYTSLRILSDADPYAGQFGKQGFYKQLTASIVSALGLSFGGAHTYQMSHSTTGSTNTVTFYPDDPATPTVSGQAVSGVTHTSGKYVSGVPCLTTGDTIQAGATANNAVKAFYNPTRIIRFSGSQVSNRDYQPGTPPVNGASVASGTQNITVATGYTTGAVITVTAYNSKGGTGTGAINSVVRIDSVSNEAARKLSGSGDTPSSGYGGTYDSTQSLKSGAYVNELQVINGAYQYPPATNYGTRLPPGPDYSSGMGSADRWVTLIIDAAFSGTGRTIAIAGATNFGSNAIVSGLKMYVRVDGSSPTAGWVDLNASYPGVGNPTNNGDPALAPGSTATSRILTFGSVVRTGTLYLRIGLPSGSNKTFTGAS